MEKCSDKLRKQLECYAAKLDDVKELDITTTNEYKMIKEKETALRASNDIDKKLKELREDEMKLQSEMNEITLKIAETFNNDIIDEKIDKLLKEQVEFEQSKANCEKILYQLDLLNRKKNELLTDDINSNFELVDFKLFDYRKNGDYVECCIPRYKGKDLKVATNTGLEILMKLDIIKGLQKFYDLQLPVFIDCAESLSKESRTKINMDCQMTYLTVSEHEKLNINGSNN